MVSAPHKDILSRSMDSDGVTKNMVDTKRRTRRRSMTVDMDEDYGESQKSSPLLAGLTRCLPSPPRATLFAILWTRYFCVVSGEMKEKIRRGGGRPKNKNLRTNVQCLEIITKILCLETKIQRLAFDCLQLRPTSLDDSDCCTPTVIRRGFEPDTQITSLKTHLCIGS